MTVLYDAEDNWKVLCAIHGTVWPRVLGWCVFFSFMTGVVFELNAYGIDITFQNAGHSYMSVLVSFLLVTRLTRSLTRFWEARSGLSKAHRACRNLSMLTLALTGADASDSAVKWRSIVKDRLIRLVRTTMRVVEDEAMSIRLMQGDWDEHDKNLAHPAKRNTEAFIVDPLDIALSLEVIITKHDTFLQKPLSIVQHNQLLGCVTSFVDAYYDLTKYNTTPIPFTIVNMGRTLVFIWLFCLPMVLVHDMDRLIPCVVQAFFITYGFIGLEQVLIEVHDPFGDDPNDFEVYRYTEMIVRGIKKDLEGENIKFWRRGSDDHGKACFKSNVWDADGWNKRLVYSFSDCDDDCDDTTSTAADSDPLALGMAEEGRARGGEEGKGSAPDEECEPFFQTLEEGMSEATESTRLLHVHFQEN